MLTFISKKIKNENLIFFTKRYLNIYRKSGELYLRIYILRLLKYFYCASQHKKIFSVPYKTESVTNISILAMFQTTEKLKFHFLTFINAFWFINLKGGLFTECFMIYLIIFLWIPRQISLFLKDGLYMELTNRNDLK